MPSKYPAQRLTDIVENIDAIAEFIGTLRFEDFCKDRKTVYAVTRALVIISTATRRLPAELHLRHAQIDWVAVAAAGNVYRHEYDAVDEMLIWNTVQNSLAELRRIAALELGLLGNSSQ